MIDSGAELEEVIILVSELLEERGVLVDPDLE